MYTYSFHQVSPPNLLCTCLVPHMCQMPCPFFDSWFDHLINIWWWVKIVMLFTVRSSQLPVTSSLLGQIHSSAPLEHPQPVFLPQCNKPNLMCIKIRGKITILCMLIFMFLDSKLLHQMIARTPQLQPVLKFWIVHETPTLTLCRSYLNRYCLGRKTAFFSVGI
jgi:hypothetical protein